jgi:Zn-finger nucleic acid-binding protein
MEELVECPRCLQALRGSSGKMFTCADCLGLFVPRGAMGSVLEAVRAGRDLELSMAPYRSMFRSGAQTAELSRYLPCPECADMMNRTELIAGAGVVVDMCLQHGVWFDRGELSHAASFVMERVRAEGRQFAESTALESIASALGRFFKLE